MRTDKNSIIKFGRKVGFYVRNFSLYFIPDFLYTHSLMRKFKRLSHEDKHDAELRAEYYNKLPEGCLLDNDKSVVLQDYKFPFGRKRKHSSYFFDLHETVRCFAPSLRIGYIFGDIDYESSFPAFVKARPISEGHSNSVICKLNKVRHFRFINDPVPFERKKDMMIFRNVVKKQPHRTRFIEALCNKPLCDVGQINPDGCELHPEYVKPFVPIEQQMQYKFIACIEGHDVATNLKWVMASNSIAVMPKPKIESWFMEGTLTGGYHYIEINDDYSDVEDKIKYYSTHPEEAKAIIRHAHEYVEQFMNEDKERYIQYLVVRKFFERTTQSK